MKESKCFSSKKKDHTTYDCSKKSEVTAISENLSKNNNSQENG